MFDRSLEMGFDGYGLAQAGERHGVMNARRVEDRR